MDDESLTTSIAEHESHRHSRCRQNDVLWDRNSPIENDGRSKTETKFYPQEAANDKPVKRDKRWMSQWEWLAKLNDGHRANDIKSNPYNAKRDLKTWMSQLDATDYQINRACHIYDSRPSDPNKDGYVVGIRTEVVLLGVITLVLNEDGRRIRSEKQFKEIRDTLDVSSDMIKNVRKKLHSIL